MAGGGGNRDPYVKIPVMRQLLHGPVYRDVGEGGEREVVVVGQFDQPPHLVADASGTVVPLLRSAHVGSRFSGAPEHR